MDAGRCNDTARHPGEAPPQWDGDHIWLPLSLSAGRVTAASNQQYELEKKYKDEPADPDNDYWFKMMRVVIDSVANATPYRHGYEKVPVTKLDKLGRFCRFRAVREQRESHLRVAEVMDMILASIKKRQA